MQLKNLAKDYVKNDLIRWLFNYMKFLPFVPLKNVIQAFKKIKELGSSCEKFQPMFAYFEKIYIGQLQKNIFTSE